MMLYRFTVIDPKLVQSSQISTPNLQLLISRVSHLWVSKSNSELPIFLVIQHNVMPYLTRSRVRN